jgi:Uma2 family endonuclease
LSTDIHSFNLDTTEYPSSDGQPMAENNEQLRLIFLIKNELDALFAGQDVAVEGDLLWYPVQYHPDISRAPDTMVIFGRPKRYRRSYMQWLENNVPPQVAFEILSPSNKPEEMLAKRNFYETYGVEEYYEYNPESLELRGWQRVNGLFQAIPQMNGWISPRLGIRFEIDDYGQLQLYRPNGQLFRSFVELENRLIAEQQRAEAETLRAKQERLRAEAEIYRAERERQRTLQAQQQTEQERQAKETALQQAEQERQAKETERLKAEQERQAKETALQQAVQERQAKEAEQARTLQAQEQIGAERQAKEAAEQRAEVERQRAEKLAAKLRKLNIDLDEP